MSNKYSTIGYFNACGLDFSVLVSTETDVTFQTEVPEGKDQFALLVNVSTGQSHLHTVTVIGQNGFPDKPVSLVSGGLNVIRIPTYGYTDKDGKANFIFSSGKGSISSLSVGVAVTNHIDALNN